MSDIPPDPTAKQMRHVYAGLRNLGRAMASLHAAKLPMTGPRFGTMPDWQWAFIEAVEATQKASNRLVDGIEALEPGYVPEHLR